MWGEAAADFEVVRYGKWSPQTSLLQIMAGWLHIFPANPLPFQHSMFFALTLNSGSSRELPCSLWNKKLTYQFNNAYCIDSIDIHIMFQKVSMVNFFCDAIAVRTCRLLNLFGIESPGLTSALSLAEEVLQLVEGAGRPWVPILPRVFWGPRAPSISIPWGPYDSGWCPSPKEGEVDPPFPPVGAGKGFSGLTTLWWFWLSCNFLSLLNIFRNLKHVPFGI